MRTVTPAVPPPAESCSLEEHGYFKLMNIHNSLLHLMLKASSRVKCPAAQSQFSIAPICLSRMTGALVTLFSSYLSRSTSSIPCQFKFYTRSFYSFCISFIQFISWTSIVHLLNISYIVISVMLPFRFRLVSASSNSKLEKKLKDRWGRL
jgi:hypothetical protein